MAETLQSAIGNIQAAGATMILPPARVLHTRAEPAVAVT